MLSLVVLLVQQQPYAQKSENIQNCRTYQVFESCDSSLKTMIRGIRSSLDITFILGAVKCEEYSRRSGGEFIDKRIHVVVH